MNARQRALIAPIFSTVAVAGLVLTGCSSHDRAGGDAGDPALTLTLGIADNQLPPTAIATFGDNVAKLSHGQLKITYRADMHHADPRVESLLVGDVRADTVDLAWVGARTFDRLGVTSFEPMLAPLLVDSEELQGRVFDAGIADAMLAGVGRAGVVGVGVLPGPLRRPLSKGSALTTPGAFAGMRVATDASNLSERTYRQLAATPVPVGFGASIAAVGAIDQQLASDWGNHYEEKGAKNVVGNLNLWPRPLVIIGSTTAWQRLTPAQQSVLRAAAKVSQAPALDAARREDTDAVGNLCKAGIKMPAVTPDQLAAFEAALRPVYDSIAAASSQDKTWLDQIRALKTASAPPPDTISCPGATSSPQQAAGALPNGTYAYTFDPVTDLTRFCTKDDPGWPAMAPLEGKPPFRVEMVLDGDSIKQYDYSTGTRNLGWLGTYRSFRSTFELDESSTNEVDSLDYTFDGKTLTLTHPRGMHCDGNAVWTSHPWRLEPATPQIATIPENVTFFTTMAAADWAACAPGDGAETNEIVFQDGIVRLYNIPAGSTQPTLGFKDSYTIYRDKLTLGAYTVTWKLTGKTLVLSNLTNGECGDRVVWTAHPWTRR
jgi:TRAP-type C4-dicarboxylate transport system substrate-binding protein